METFPALLAICVNSLVPGEFPTQRPMTRSFDVFFDLCLNKRLSKQSWGWWFETLSCPLWRQCGTCPSVLLSETRCKPNGWQQSWKYDLDNIWGPIWVALLWPEGKTSLGNLPSPCLMLNIPVNLNCAGNNKLCIETCHEKLIKWMYLILIRAVWIIAVTIPFSFRKFLNKHFHGSVRYYHIYIKMIVFTSQCILLPNIVRPRYMV